MSLIRLRKYLLTGLLIWVPMVITLWVLQLIIGTLDGIFHWLPPQWQPESLIQFNLPLFGQVKGLPGLGVVITLLVLLLTGLTVSNILGKRIYILWENVLSKIPVFKTIYSSVKQVSDTLLSSNGQAFRKALLVHYPHQGSWTIAFQTGTPTGEVAEILPPDMVSVYVPTTPNPTSGFFLIVPKSETKELEMSVDEALKYIISMGVVAPKPGAHPHKEEH
ncbi:DUF502 domain-containing protein [Leeia sp. TBRC 13508]|uniref:DUF502 domain-containing protein n=1 Tax=Leeia speluncae TaxID=2884804 RepID=A0ABS8DAQ3_9NEIS|nr:DUF502 domain-containing protein [Leeia speluncae]MCB6185287.1 DUF502 domain-containing protein [Leeia speluncae]